jgi:FRG domain
MRFRGQKGDYRNRSGNTALKPSLFRAANGSNPGPSVLMRRFDVLKKADARLGRMYTTRGFAGRERLQRQQILRWSILQHYEICPTPLLDVTQSLRIAASFASDGEDREAFVFVLGVPNLSGAITASAEAGIQVVRLSSVCPPAAVRPHIQEGYLLGEYPEMTGYDQKQHYAHWEIDFGRRLIAKFRFNPQTFWKNDAFPKVIGPLSGQGRSALQVFSVCEELA